MFSPRHLEKAERVSFHPREINQNNKSDNILNMKCLRGRCEMNHSGVSSTNMFGVLFRQASKHIVGLLAQLPRGKN